MTSRRHATEKDLSSIAVLIPAWRPESVLIRLTRELMEAGVGAVVIVDDGSEPCFEPLFQRVRRNGGLVLRHEMNMGRGRALKTGLTFLSTCGEFRGVVSADADGQHTVEDILGVARRLRDGSGRPVLGVRSFSNGVPLRSRLGNEAARRLFSLVTGVRLGDTQTGLRGLPMTLVPELVELPGDRYEYEMAMLACLCRDGAVPEQVLIETVYIDGNRSSHFDPLLDSIRIYFVLARIFFSSGTGANSRAMIGLR